MCVVVGKVMVRGKGWGEWGCRQPSRAAVAGHHGPGQDEERARGRGAGNSTTLRGQLTSRFIVQYIKGVPKSWVIPPVS